MNPTTPTPEATMRSKEHYLADNPGSAPLSTLGMTADGRIVRLQEQDEQQRPGLQQALEQQLGALLPPKEDKALWDWIVEDTATTEFQTLGHVLNRVRRDRQIRQRLGDLKVQYGAEFAIMNECTQTIDKKGKTKTRGRAGRDDPEDWGYRFENDFTPTHWTFINNAKYGKTIAKNFYMSNVIAHQFEWTFQRNGWLLELPATIERHQIVNKRTLEVLLQHQSDYHSDAFRKDFLETTVNGKSTVRVARDLGLKIDRLTVTYYDEPVDQMDAATYEPDDTPFSVIVHVSPDPAVYGSP